MAPAPRIVNPDQVNAEPAPNQAKPSGMSSFCHEAARLDEVDDGSSPTASVGLARALAFRSTGRRNSGASAVYWTNIAAEPRGDRSVEQFGLDMTPVMRAPNAGSCQTR